jgi:hypothetical protein
MTARPASTTLPHPALAPRRSAFTQRRAGAVPMLALALLGALTGACGRQERVIEITSTPPGALVWLNDVELGRTPVRTDFLHFGTYDVRLQLSGYEPVITSREASPPLHELPPIDLVAAALPGTRRTLIPWHFDLVAVVEKTDREAGQNNLIDRARGFRQTAGGQPAAAPAAQPTPATGEPSGG